MDRLAEMEAFVTVVDAGGFTEAARKLEVSKSAISKSVSALEGRLGVRLLNRTTRRVNPTDVGLAYYDRARAVIRDARDADSMVTAMQDMPKGSLRISVPVSFGIGGFSKVIAGFLAAYPEVEIDMVLDDRFVELVAEGYDLAIRIGTLADSSLKARKIAEARIHLVASPEYLAAHGTPITIEALNQHDLLHYSYLSTGNFWRLRSSSGQERQIRAGGRLTVNNANSLRKAAETGIGIAWIPNFALGDSLTSGRLVEILPETASEPFGVYAVYPPGPFPQPKLRALIDYLVEHYRGQGPDQWEG
ncbi:LysR family transcriptional regulator [Amaricoccus macauensis]|uniref:LysR family transcriptional regulator n=1 Tax=Amaricoccus macauensis TaxID=57001 RepID=UPI003C7B3595